MPRAEIQLMQTKTSDELEVRKRQMATDYDAPRRNESEDPSEDSLEELKARRNEAQSAVVDIDEWTPRRASSCPAPTCPARN